jgi:hypothetical protein
MKLQLKHLAPYLPYGLKIKLQVGDVLEMSASAQCYNEIGIITLTINDNPFHKPLLRPLPQLTEAKLIHAGFESHIDWLTNEREHWIKTYGYEGMINKVPYIYVTWLLKNHYDIFNLIDNNLAIAIHDEPQKENQPI